MIEIDGSMGEGGGQVLRSALSASLITGIGFRIKNIRSRRSRPGLGAQHLKAIDAAAAVGQARVEGAQRNSTEVTFTPRSIRTGKYTFDIGTAGSTSLVLQTILIPLSLARSATSVSIKGGTHVPMAPCFHYLDNHWVEYLGSAGFDVMLKLDQAGFYPQGGGRISSIIRPANQINSIDLRRRSHLLAIQGTSGVANLSRNIAERQKQQAIRRLKNICNNIHIRSISIQSPGKGTFITLRAIFDSPYKGYQPACCYIGLGELGKPAERVADDAVEQVLSFLSTDAAIDSYLTDQLLLPLALAQDESFLYTNRISQHLLTNAEVIKKFIPVKIEISGNSEEPGTVTIQPYSKLDYSKRKFN
jgi:RNA 3'-terminal phosphate cyclase (ATP)